nr:MAG TPA: hypothetical protein [Caudoviricetes sp.]DAP11081.1 MAG TPA: hypothetical protein [Caudoviricetes sp.]DAR89063.1 MAG TPA: hypothetical protein [Caudoviricetes sp.]
MACGVVVVVPCGGLFCWLFVSLLFTLIEKA